MKKIRNAVLILALFLCFNGCEKKMESEEQMQLNDPFSVEQAEAWFGSEWTGAIHLKSGDTEQVKIGIKPDWCNGFTSQNTEI